VLTRALASDKHHRRLVLFWMLRFFGTRCTGGVGQCVSAAGGGCCEKEKASDGCVATALDRFFCVHVQNTSRESVMEFGIGILPQMYSGSSWFCRMDGVGMLALWWFHERHPTHSTRLRRWRSFGEGIKVRWIRVKGKGRWWIVDQSGRWAVPYDAPFGNRFRWAWHDFIQSSLTLVAVGQQWLLWRKQQRVLGVAQRHALPRLATMHFQG